ncbi:AAA family ATPase [Streptomyces rubradiris]|uniref:AAA family ATPase n=1 Tax=Streptomyces rubradiris TaxID=285531 RepID=UPI0036E648D2
MRPLSITLSGVRSYIGTCGPLDFTQRSLVGILGDTGAGKSTLLEAITYALYGRTSWGDHGTQLIADGCEKMSIDFTFTVDGTAWRVIRVCHRGDRSPEVRLSSGDTDGTAVNGVRPVNRRIQELLNLDYASFTSAVLLPQGKFDTLLNATGTARTQLLRSLLGIDELQRLGRRAEDHRARVDALLRKATEARGRLREDPEADAHRLRSQQTEAEKSAAELSGHLDTLRRLQHEAGGLQQHGAETARAASALAERTATNVQAPLAALVTYDRILQEQLDTLDRTHEDTTRQRDLLQAALDENRGSGLTITALAAAAEVLQAAPGLLSPLGEQQQELQQDLDRLREDDHSIQEDSDRLAKQAARLPELDEDAERARKQVEEAETALARLTATLRVLLEEGAAVVEHHAAQAAARSRLDDLTAASATADTALEEQRGRLQEAAKKLEAVQRGEAAHTAGASLSPGDACPVCTHPLDAAYTAPDPRDPKALKRAKRAHSAAATAVNDALTAQQQVQADIRQAEQDEQHHLQAADAARDRLSAQLSPARDHARSVAALTGHDEPDSFAAHLVADITTTADTLLAQTQPSATERLTLLDTLLEGARARTEDAHRSAARIRDTAASATADVHTAQAVLTQRRKTLETARKKARQEQQRLDRARQQFLTRLEALPRPVQISLPDEDALPSPEAIAACASAVTTHLERLSDLDREYTQVLGSLQQLAQQREDLAGEHRRRVAQPLRQQQTTLELRAEAATAASRLLNDAAVTVPSPPAAWDKPQDVAAYASALDAACADLREALDALQRATQATLKELASRAAAAFRTLTPLAPKAPLPPTANPDLLFTPSLLAPFHEQAGALQSQAAQAASGLAEATSQIPYARALDAAIKAGEQQQSAWAGLREELNDSRFPRHLAELRTHSLLTLGSRLLKDLSAGRFAFSKDFQIVSLGNNTARSPRTLSGGETFQASLALSLALVELHNRTSARLESLFLDEGFATLDAGALESALSTLRTHVGGDKLLAVISHLHPVAESVNDVLWVEKDVSGSTARWLTPQEHHTLVRSDFHNLADLT